MDFWQASVLSVVEGVSEFLPISSTGHLILTARILNIAQTDFVKSFEIFIQLGAILAVVVLYFKRYVRSVKAWQNVLAAFLATAVIAFPAYKLIKDVLLGNAMLTVASLFIGGIALIILEKIHQERDHHIAKMEDLTIKQSALIGLIQAVSVIPGVSRSAATILGAMFLGARREAAVEFSFLLAVPTMMGATGLDLAKERFHYNPHEWLMLTVGFAGAFLSALIIVRWFIGYVRKNNFVVFGVYRIVLAVFFWLVVLR